MSAGAFNEPLSHAKPHGYTISSKCGQWQIMNVCGGWLYTRFVYSYDSTTGQEDYIPQTPVFVPYPSNAR